MVLAFRILVQPTQAAAVLARIPHQVPLADRQLAARAATDPQQVLPGVHLLDQAAVVAEQVEQVALAAAATVPPVWLSFDIWELRLEPVEP